MVVDVTPRLVRTKVERALSAVLEKLDPIDIAYPDALAVASVTPTA